MIADAVYQPAEYPAHTPKTVAELVMLYGGENTGNPAIDLASTTLNYRYDVHAGEIEITSGRYDGQLYSATTGKALPPKPVVDRETP